jgi:hypothetical protein
MFQKCQIRPFKLRNRMAIFMLELCTCVCDIYVYNLSRTLKHIAMNALLALLAWFIGIFNPSQASLDVNPGADPSTIEIGIEDTRDVHILNHNPRTVVALEDTHFKPSR